MKSLFSLLLCLLAGPALAQTSPGFVTGQTLPAAQLNSAFAAKQDFPAPSAGGYLIFVTASPYNAVCDGVTDAHVAINAAIAAAVVPGGVIQFPAGTCYLGTAGILINGNVVRLQGQGASALAAITTGTVLTYSGTGAAVTVSAQNVFNYNSGIDNIQIRATGSAHTSATAGGLVLNNVNYFLSHNLGVYGFEAGFGITSQANGTSCVATTCFTASSEHYNLNIFDVKTGFLATIINGNANSTEGLTTLHGGWIICGPTTTPVTGTRGIDMEANAITDTVDQVDIEYCDTAVYNNGRTNYFAGVSFEGNNQDIKNDTSSQNAMWFGVKNGDGLHSVATLYQDLGTGNHFYGSTAGQTGVGGIATNIGKNFRRASPDGPDADAQYNASGTLLHETNTSTGFWNLSNGFSIRGYSDTEVTATWNMNTATGFLSLGGEYITPLTDGAMTTLTNHAGNVFEVCTSNATVALSNCSVENGADWAGYSDNGVTRTYDFDASTGNAIFSGSVTGGSANFGTGNLTAGLTNLRSLYVKPVTDASDIYQINNAAGSNVYDCGTNATVGNSYCAFDNGITVTGYSDTLTTVKWSLNSASGLITGQSFKAGSSSGVSCSGTPTASFASVNGIVTHC